jgi:hypothetical protein
MKNKKGYLLVNMEPPSTLEEEFNDWYDTEHIPERKNINGFETALRYVSISGWPKYLAFYDLSNHEVLYDEGYLSISGNNFSPWSKRVLGKVRGQYRAEGKQIYPGNSLSSQCARLLILRFKDVEIYNQKAVIQSSKQAFKNVSGISNLRIFEFKKGKVQDLIILIESFETIDTKNIDYSKFETLKKNLDLINEYIPYWIRGELPGVYDSSAH